MHSFAKINQPEVKDISFKRQGKEANIKFKHLKEKQKAKKEAKE